MDANRKRFIVEIGTGIDIHGENVTKAACRAVKDAVSRSCLCGLLEILELKNLEDVQVDIQVASPSPDQVDLEQVMAEVPIGRKSGHGSRRYPEPQAQMVVRPSAQLSNLPTDSVWRAGVYRQHGWRRLFNRCQDGLPVLGATD